MPSSHLSDTDGLVGRAPAREAPPNDFWAWVRCGRRAEPAPSYRGLIEDPDPDDPAVGICCSGGGIRSAAFNLGALQALGGRRILENAKYVSAVSGGSYIASSLFMVASTHGRDGSDEAAFDADHPPFHPGSPEEQYLRNRSSYLAPDGLGKLFLGYRVLLGLAFNLVFVGLLMVATGILLAEVLYGRAFGHLTGLMSCNGTRECYSVTIPVGAWIAIAAVGVLALVCGLLVLLLRAPSDGLRRFCETWAVRLLLVEALLATLLLLVPYALEVVRDYGAQVRDPSAVTPATKPALPAIGAGSLTSLLVAVLLQVRAKATEPAEVLHAATGARTFFRKLAPRLRLLFTYLAGAVAGPIVLLAMLLGGAAYALGDAGRPTSHLGPWYVFAATVGVFGVLYWLADLTSWSLHPFYKRRLCTAFALKRVGDATHREAQERDYGNLLLMSDVGRTPPPGKSAWPSLIVCAAANISDPGATPPGRGVTSFTFTNDEIGGPLIGGIRTADYEHAVGSNRQRDVTLPAVVAMSGAALSPSMGKLTHRPLTFLMALANVRLGVWIPNPKHMVKWHRRTVLGRRKQGSARDLAKRPRPSYLFRELLGRNRVDGKFLYVSDGGHYENLGLVELLRRGCLHVYCFDASGGRSPRALGDAIALARSELDVEIAIDPAPVVASTGGDEVAARDCVSGRITYPDGSQGTLVYARTVMTRGVPFDVRAYHEGDRTFPHTTTADQLYTDQKFEAYRTLGSCAGDHAAQEMDRAVRKAEAARRRRPQPSVTQHDARQLVPASADAPAPLPPSVKRPRFMRP